MAATVGGRKFLERFFRNCKKANFELRVLDTKKKRTKIVFQKAYSTVPELISDSKKFAQQYDCFFNTAALNGGFKEEHAVAVTALRIDVDFKQGISEAEVRQMLASFPLKPSAIVRTGGGLHVYWFLSKPADPSSFVLVKLIIKALALKFRADLNVCDIPRILRIPGTTNFKPDYDPARPVILSRNDWHPEREYALSDFVSLLPVEGDVEIPPTGKAPAHDRKESRELLPLYALHEVFKSCAACNSIRRNVTETGQFVPEGDNREHSARFAVALLSKFFYDGPEWVKETLFALTNDHDPKIMEGQFASVRAKGAPRCSNAGLCGGKEQCDAIRAIRGNSPIKFGHVARREAKKAAAVEVVTEAFPGLERFRATDLWNARLFAYLNHDKVRYCGHLGGWFHYAGKRWARSEGGEVERLAKDIPREMYSMASGEPDKDRRDAIAKHAARTEAVGKIAAILELAKTEKDIAIPREMFDAHPWLFNVSNGTLDLVPGELRPHRAEDMLTNISPAEYRWVDAEGKQFKKFLAEAMDGDQEKIGFLQRAAGYTLSGDMREQVFLFCHGPEAAGKGTFVRTLADVMGDYAQSTEIDTFLTSRRDRVRNDVAALVGSRMVTASEPEDGQVFDEGLVKILTGQDRTKARFLYHEPFEFSSTFKLWFQGNHRPHIRSTGGAMWRRLLIVPFTKTIPEDRRDKALGDRLRSPEERAGILAWMVRGCLEWQRVGLRSPASVRATVAEYRQAEDRVAPFLEECTVERPSGQVSVGEFYTKYKVWAEASGERPMSKKALGMCLVDKGFTPGRTTKGARAWNGLLLVKRGKGI